MATVRKAYIDDFERVYKLLTEFANPRIGKEDWKELFTKRWERTEDYFGFLVEDAGEVVGFIATIFSNRLIGGKQEKICNISSWIVKPVKRIHTLSLFKEILRLKDYTVTALSSSKNAHLFQTSLGFKDLCFSFIILPPIPSISHSNINIYYDKQIKVDSLEETWQKIIKDHFFADNYFIVISCSYGICLIVGNRRYIKRLPILKINYISNLEVFTNIISNISASICMKYKVLSIVIDEYLLKGFTISRAIKMPKKNSMLYLSKTLEPCDLDNLYSELMFLNF